MFKNYFYLNRAVVELNKIIQQQNVVEVYSQEKDSLYLHIPSEELPFRHLIISTDSSQPFIRIKDDHRKAKKNLINFFNGHFPTLLACLKIAEGERIIKFEFSKSELYFMIRGGNSNVFFVDKYKNVSPFRKQKISDENLLDELENLNFTDKYYYPDLSLFSENNYDVQEIRKRFPFISKDYFKELDSMNLDNYSDRIKILTEIINKVRDDNIAIYYSEIENKLVFKPLSFYLLDDSVEKFVFDEYQLALSKYLSLSYQTGSINHIKKEISNYLEKEISQLSNKLNKLKPRIDEGSKELQYRNYGDLLASNRYKFVKGSSSIVLSDFDTGEEVKIKLDQKKDVQQNIDFYFDKARGEKINYEKSIQLFEETEKKYNSLLKLRESFESAQDIVELKTIKSKLNIKTKVIDKNKMELDIKLRHFVLDGQYHVFVGRDSRSNDLLSTKFAKQNDYWFHARGLPGSHTTLRVDNPKEGVPKNIIKNAASIAAYYSKAKTAKIAPVSYTLRKFVNKKKGMAPGKVSLTKENVILVKPEIPKNAEQIED